MPAAQPSSPPPAEEPEATGLAAGLGRMASNFAGLLTSRIELAALEFSEVRANFLKLAAIGALGLVLAWFAIAYWSVLLVVLAWPALGWKILLLLALGFSVAAGAAYLYLRAMLDQDKLSMPATMNELRKDRDALL